MKIALISPKGPLYRHRGGIFRQSLRYQPLTLTTLASLVPDDLNAEFTLIDEGIADVDLDPRRRPRRDDGHHRHRAARLRAGRPLPIARHHDGPRRAARHARPGRRPAARRQHRRRLRRGHAGRSCCAISRRDGCGRATTRRPGLTSRGRPFPRRDLLPGRRFLTDNVFEATRGCVHDCDFCVVPAAWGRKPLPEAGRGRRRRHPPALHGARKLIFVDLNLIADRDYAARAVRRRWCRCACSGTACRPTLLGRRSTSCSTSPRAAAAAACCSASSRSRRQPARQPQGVQQAGADYARRRRAAARARHRGAGLLRVRHGRGRAGRVSEQTARFAVEARSTCRASPSSRRSPARAAQAPRARGPHPDARLGAVRRAARRLPAGADERAASSSTAPSARGSIAYSLAVDRAPAARTRPRRCTCAQRRTSATGSTPINLHRFYNCDWIIGRGAASAGPGGVHR